MKPVTRKILFSTHKWLGLIGGTWLMLLMFELHNGKIIHEGFRWVLDTLAIMALLMVITGPILWWRCKW